MSSLSEEFPEVGVGESGIGSNFQFQEMVLVGVEIDSVDSSRGFEGV